MKLLITTQAVDSTDPILGFFVRWIAEFAKHCEKVTVICLREGPHQLPSNVEVQVLESKPRFLRAVDLLTYSITHRKQYDTVFVHMNPEYAVVAGFLWRLMGKKIALWYTHKNVDLKLRVAVFFSHLVFSASKESFRLNTSKLFITGHGIDTEFFTPDTHTARGTHILSAGRLTKSKRHDLVIAAAALANRELRIIGDGPERNNLETLAKKLNARVTFVGGLTQAELRDEYRKAQYFVHASETGSLDKVVLEALACELPVITTSAAYAEFSVQKVAPNAEAIAAALQDHHIVANAEIIREKHSITQLIPKLLKQIETPPPKVLFLFTNSKEALLSRVNAGVDADTSLRGLNHFPNAAHAAARPKSFASLLLLSRLLSYDFIIAQDNLLLGYVVSRLSWLMGGNTRWLYVAMTSSTLIRKYRTHPIRLFLLKKMWTSYARIICISKRQMEDLIHLGVPSEHLVFIPYGVDGEFFKATGDARSEDYVLSVGRDIGRDYKTLCMAAEHSDHKYIVVASPRNIPGDYPVPKNVEVFFNLPLEKLKDVYARATVIVVPSQDEQIPIGSDCSGQVVILDAMASGKAVIATRRSWIEDYFTPGEDLLVVEPGDPQALARAVEELFLDSSRRTSLAKNGHVKMSVRYTTSAFAQSLERLMHTL